MCASRNRDHEAARQLAKQALMAAQCLPHGESRMAMVLICECFLAFFRKRFQRAEDLGEAALQAINQLQAIADLQVDVLEHYSDVKVARGKYSQAAELLEQSMSTHTVQTFERRQLQISQLKKLGRIYSMVRRQEESQVCYKLAQALSGESPELTAIAKVAQPVSL